MIVYNITSKISPEIEAEWVAWQKEEHISEIISTGLFIEHKFFRLVEPGEPDGVIYVIQYFCVSMENYDQYIEIFAPQLRKKALAKWGDHFIAFRSIMELVQ